MSDQAVGKAIEERWHFEVFEGARAQVTNEDLQFVRQDERPDIVVRRESGSYAGVELTQVFLNPPDPATGWRRGYDWSRDFDVLDAVWRAVSTKAEKRISDGWQYRLQTILVLTLMDAPLGEVAWVLEDVPIEDWQETGFREVWVVDFDHDNLDAYGADNVRLFAGFPKKWHGFHERPQPWRKPYG